MEFVLESPSAYIIHKVEHFSNWKMFVSVGWRVIHEVVATLIRLNQNVWIHSFRMLHHKIFLDILILI